MVIFWLHNLLNESLSLCLKMKENGRNFLGHDTMISILTFLEPQRHGKIGQFFSPLLPFWRTVNWKKSPLCKMCCKKRPRWFIFLSFFPYRICYNDDVKVIALPYPTLSHDIVCISSLFCDVFVLFKKKMIHLRSPIKLFRKLDMNGWRC